MIICHWWYSLIQRIKISFIVVSTFHRSLPKVFKVNSKNKEDGSEFLFKPGNLTVRAFSCAKFRSL